ncbi:MAG: efflux RND transporter periplasmic adaptor subunit [Acidobacteria bacterium]|nr:efflux RND transporter periplasmic adaptor subunit [Acidobacteriota bacterium]
MRPRTLLPKILPAMLTALLHLGTLWADVGHSPGAAGQEARTATQRLSGQGREYQVTWSQKPAQPKIHQIVELEWVVVEKLPEFDPLLGDEVPWNPPPGKAVLKKAGKVVEMLDPHGEGEAGRFGIHYTFREPGEFELRVPVAPAGLETSWSVQVAATPAYTAAGTWKVLTGLLTLAWLVTAGFRVATGKASKKRGLSHVLAAALFLVGTWSLAHWIQHRSAEGSTPGPPSTASSTTLAPQLRELVGIRTVRVKPESLRLSLSVLGRVQAKPELKTEVVAPLWGRIEYVGKRLFVGDRVQKGERLVQVILELSQAERYPLDDRTLDIQNALDRSAQRTRSTLADYQRALRLTEKDPAYQSWAEWRKKLYMSAVEEHNLASRQRQTQEQTVQRRDPRFTPVGAPISGVITDIHFTPGEVNLTDEFKKLFTIVDLSRVWVQAWVFERDLEEVIGTRQATVRTPAYPDLEWAGAFQATGAEVHRDDRTVQVIFEVQNPGERLKLGMAVNVSIQKGSPRKVFLLPLSAVLQSNGQNFVYRVASPQAYEASEVQLGQRRGDHVEVLSGLSAGDEVVVEGAFEVQAALRAGTSTIQDESQPHTH